jgi:hypothetical protein
MKNEPAYIETKIESLWLAAAAAVTSARKKISAGKIEHLFSIEGGNHQWRRANTSKLSWR